MSVATKLEYLNDTKQLLKENINNLGGNLTNEPFRQYASVLEGIYERIPKVSGIGASLSLSPSMVGKIKLNEIQGDTLQNGTPTPSSPVPIQSVTGLQNVGVCGKNILNVKDGSYSYGTTNSWVVQNHEVKMSVNDITYQGGCLRLVSGTTSRWIDGTDNHITSSGTYTLSVNKTGTLTFGSEGFLQFFVRLYNDDGTLASGTSLVIRDNQNKYTHTFTVDSGKHIGEVGIYSQFIQCQDVEFKIQIEKGSTATTYEPYKGNTYEVNLGKNLLPNTNTTQVLNNITFTKNDDDSFKINGTANANTSYRINTLGNELSLTAGTYTISTGNNLTSGITLQGWHSTATNFVTIQSSSNKASFTLTNDVSNVRFQIVITNGTQISNLTIYPMLEKGSQATSYSPYFTPIELNKIGDYKDSIKKSTGKNLFNATLDRYATNRVRTNVYSVLPNTTYTISVGTSGISVVNYYKDINQSDISDSGLKSMPYTFTTPNNCYYIQQIIRKSDDSNITLDELSTIMLNEGSTALPYEPYGKVWYITKNIGERTLNGSEEWTYLNNNIFYAYVGTFKFLLNSTGTIGVCDKYKCVDSSATADEFKNLASSYNYAFNFHTQSNHIRIKDTRYTSATDLKTQLQTELPKVYYVMEKPTYTVITNTELINQLESLYNAKSEDGTTNINVTSEDLSMILNVGVLKGDA